VIVGVDGESVRNDDGSTSYLWIVAASDDPAIPPVVLYDRKGITAARGWSFLCSLRERFATLCNVDPADIMFWTFGFQYDVNEILGGRDGAKRRKGDLGAPRHFVQRLRDNHWMRWRDWKVGYKGRGELFVGEYHNGDAKAFASFRAFDMFQWAQSSFANWMRKHDLADESVYRRIEEMKNQRSSFTADQRPEIERYCADECRYLAAGARRLVELIDRSDYQLSAFHSPASVTKRAFDVHGVAQFREAEPFPPELARAHDAAFNGGRMEAAEVGPLDGPFSYYDKNSAYASAAIDLPCLRCGHWVHHDDPFATTKLHRASWRCRDRNAKWGPFPMQARVGSKRYPTSGSGWLWDVELRAGERFADVTIKETWSYIARCDHRPFAWAGEMYAQRQRLKAPPYQAEEQVLKLALAAIYGVLAEHPHRRGNEVTIPSRRCLPWAGLITARLRADILDVLADDVVMIATDAIVLRGDRTIPTSNELGAWGEPKTFDRIWAWGTGRFYASVDGTWDDQSNRTRGFAVKEVPLNLLMAHWACVGRDSTLPVPRHRYVGYTAALKRIHGWEPPHAAWWRRWIDDVVSVKLDLAPRRRWQIEDDRFDGRTLAPTQTQHRTAARRDAKLLQLWKAERDHLVSQRIKLGTAPDVKTRRMAEILTGITDDEMAYRIFVLDEQIILLEKPDGDAELMDSGCDPIAVWDEEG